MLRIEDVQTRQEAEKFYHDVVRNCGPDLIISIEADPQERPGDCAKVRAAKAAYTALQSFGGQAGSRQLHKSTVF